MMKTIFARWVLGILLSIVFLRLVVRRLQLRLWCSSGNIRLSGKRRNVHIVPALRSYFCARA